MQYEYLSIMGRTDCAQTYGEEDDVSLPPPPPWDLCIDDKRFYDRTYEGNKTDMCIAAYVDEHGARHHEAFPNTYTNRMRFVGTLEECLAWCDRWGPVIDRVVLELLDLIDERRRSLEQAKGGKRR